MEADGTLELPECFTDPPHKPCPECEGTGACPWCGGKLEDVPHEFSQAVIGSVMIAWYGVMEGTRSVQRFDLFEAQWATLQTWMVRMRRECPAPTPEEFERMATAFVEADAPDGGSKRTAAKLTGAKLTEQELRDLGILDSDGNSNAG